MSGDPLLLQLGLGNFSTTVDAASASHGVPPPPSPSQQDPLPCYQQSVEEVKQCLAAAAGELEVTRDELRSKEQNIAALTDLIRRTTQERDLLLQQHQLILARELEAMTSSSSPLPSSPSPVTAHPSAMMINPLDVPSSAAVVAAAEERSKAADAHLEMLAAKRPLPQRGRLLQAVMDAGPLLQDLMVAVPPLPQWGNPPPAKGPIMPVPSGSSAPMGLPWSAHGNPPPARTNAMISSLPSGSGAPMGSPWSTPSPSGSGAPVRSPWSTC